jgi:GDPmannose 4,6-dehydratase
MIKKRALILGIGGQDGYFMSRLLAKKDYAITGVLRPEDMSSETITHLPYHNLRLIEGNICDEDLMRKILREDLPEQIYNFAGISFIPYSWDAPGDVARVNGFAVGQILNIIRQEAPDCRFFQAGSSEMFGHNPKCCPQDEETPFYPDNPYGSSKVFANHLVRNYRSHFGIFACTGILYNHESPLRPANFVTRKITQAAASISDGRQVSIKLGNIESVRDWSYAGDVVNAMWLMMTADEPNDYVLASGKLHSVRDVLDTAFGRLGLSWEDHVEIDQSFNRPIEPIPLCGNPAKAMRDLNWKPQVQFKDLICMMVDADLKKLATSKTGRPATCNP